jgi:hypothetical protein
VIDHENAMTQFLDILHVVAGQQCNNVMFLIVNTQKFANPFLTDHVQANRWFIEKKHARFVNECGNQLHLHPFAQRKLTDHHIHFVLHFQKLR